MTPPHPRLRRWAWRAAALPPAWVLATYFANWTVPLSVRGEAAVVLLATMVHPASGLVLVALLAPLGDAIVPLLGAVPARHAETLVIAFLAGWLSSMARDDEAGPALSAPLAGSMWLFAGVVIASFVANAAALQAQSPADLATVLWDAQRAYLMTGDLAGLHAAVPLLEGLAMVAATAQITRGDSRNRFWVLVALVSAGLIATIASGLLAFGIAPVGTLARHAAVGLPRYSAITSDVNATASLYVLLFGVSVGVALSIRRTRVAWLSAAAIMSAGLMLTGSASAGLALVTVAAVATLRWAASAASRRQLVVGLLVLSVAVAGVVAFTRTARSTSSLEMRAGFTQTSLRMVASRPVFGIGVGRYYSLSALMLSPRLSWLYGRENAHNYYLQTAAELGVVGLTLFLCVLGAAVWAPLRLIWKGRSDGVKVGCVAGVFAYLITALTGHPFLVTEVAVPFWMVIGVLAGLDANPDRSNRLRWIAIAGAGALVITAPLRGEATRVHLPSSDRGFGPPQTDAAGRVFNQAQAISSLFVGPTVTGIEIPVRLAAASRLPAAWAVGWVPGSPKTLLLIGHEWATLTLSLPGAETLLSNQRVNLVVLEYQEALPSTDASPALDVGQIRISDTRP